MSINEKAENAQDELRTWLNYWSDNPPHERFPFENISILANVDLSLLSPKPPAALAGRFHSREGLCFMRFDNGDVEIAWPGGRVTLPENEWASVVCSTSAQGETFDRWMAARVFHTDPPAPKEPA